MSEMPDLSSLALLPDAVVLVEPEGTVAHGNPMAGRLLRTGVEQLIGRPARAVLPLRDETGADWWGCVRPLEASPRIAPRIPMRDLTLLTADGRSRPVTLTASRVAAADGGLAWLVVCMRRAEARQRLDAARSDLVATVSHEIRSPLTSVKGFTKTLLAKWDRFSDGQKRQMLATVNEDADRVTRLLGELLDVSRIDAGRLRLHRRMVDVPAIAARVAERQRVADPSSEVRVEFAQPVPALYADPDKVEQIFTNLVENALKYGAGEVIVDGTVDDQAVVFEVRDHGPGIPEQYLGHIFTKFFRRSGERRSGTGLGLYITKGIIEAHGGRIWASNHAGGGAQLQFTLPQGGLELAGIDTKKRA